MINDQIGIIIFSYNRSCQLHACLESLYANIETNKLPDVTVIWKASNEDFNKGYELLKSVYQESDNLHWIKETNFKDNVTEAVQGVPWSPPEFTMFLVDDIIFVNKFSTQDEHFTLLHNNANILAISLRLHAGINKCYATEEAVEPPKFMKNNIWKWTDEKGDWGYPMSVDGNVYNTEMIKTFIRKIDFKNPNTLEAGLDAISKYLSAPHYMCCYETAPKLINIPANRVQNTYANKYAKGYTASELNKLYLEGSRIDIQAYQNSKFNTVHVPLPLKLKKD